MDKIGFIDAPFEAGKPQKYMWHFWSDEQELSGDFNAVTLDAYINEILYGSVFVKVT